MTIKILMNQEQRNRVAAFLRIQHGENYFKELDALQIQIMKELDFPEVSRTKPLSWYINEEAICFTFWDSNPQVELSQVKPTRGRRVPWRGTERNKG